MFVTGDNENQKLGISNSATIVYVPEVVPIETAVKSACCGASHTFLLSMDETKIIAFGSNEKGQLGMPKEIENITKPTEIDMEKMFDGYQLKLVACGAMHTAFVTGRCLPLMIILCKSPTTMNPYVTLYIDLLKLFVSIS